MPVRFDVIKVNNPCALSFNHFLQQRLSFNQRQNAEILPIQVKEVEGKEHTMPFTKQQVSKHWSAAFIEAGNLAIEDGTFDFDAFRDASGKLGKTVECVSVSGHQFSATILQMSERPESVDLQFI